jgi:erythromycin esterase
VSPDPQRLTAQPVHQALVFVLSAMACCAGPASPGASGTEPVVRWAAAHRLQVSARTLSDLAGDAHVVAVGEASHGASAGLEFRNQVFRTLVQTSGFSAIALESGYAESLELNAYIAGGPGDVADVARRYFTSGFGAFAENIELLRWMRDYNRTAPPGRRLTIVGIDLSLGGPTGSWATRAPVDCALRFVERAAPEGARRLRAEFSSGAGQAIDHQRVFSAADQESYEAFTRRLLSAARESGDPRGIQCARVAIQAGDVQKVAPPPGPGGIPASAWRTLEARDMAMAENVLWARGQLGRDGRLVAFAHDAHVMNAARRGGYLSGLARPPRSMGQSLRSALGTDLVIVAEAMPGQAESPDGSIELGDLLRTAGPAPYLLDLRTASGAARRWLTQASPLRINGDSEEIVTPLAAFDAVIVQVATTPARSR